MALLSALSDKVANNALIVLDAMTLENYKTKTVVETLANIGAAKKALVVYADANKVLVNSTRNIAGVKAAGVNTINTYDILNADSLVIVKDAVEKLEEVYA